MKTISIITIATTATLFTGCLFSEEEKEVQVAERCIPKVDENLNEVGMHCFKEGEEGFDVNEKCEGVLNDKGVEVGTRCVKDGVERYWDNE
jgi:hypothetical protein